MADVDVRIQAGLVFTASGPWLEPGVVEVSGERISHVGTAPTAAAAAEEVRVPVVLPGLVNTHCHTSQQLARGLADDVDLLTWLHDRIWPYEASLSEEDSEISALLCALEQIRNGVTAVADPGGQAVEGMARGLERAGIRGVLGRSTMDGGDGLPASMVESTSDCLAAQDELAVRWHGAAGGRLRMGYTLRTIFNCSDELIEATVRRAEDLGTIVQMHVAEVREENEFALATRGRTTVRHLGRLGVLNSRLLCAHVVWVDDDELDLLAAAGAKVSHNPAAALRVLGFPRVCDMLDRGLTVGLGTDGAPANNRMSLIDELWLATLLQKGMRHDPTALPAPQALRMATIDGARAIGWDDEIGSIEPGKAADLVLVDPRTANMTPLHDPLSALVTSMKSENVLSVMCAGTWLMQDRRIIAFDEEALLEEAQARAMAIATRTHTQPRAAR